jgi:hypothetical protein
MIIQTKKAWLRNKDLTKTEKNAMVFLKILFTRTSLPLLFGTVPNNGMLRTTSLKFNSMKEKNRGDLS